ncbi:MAG: hypothetical protein QF464_10655 [Myxococcota bacterium]|nr:hypothetical protein [Myxococcota bacterium]
MAKDNGLKKMWTEARTTVQTRFKDAEKVWNEAFTQINTRLQGAEKDARDFVKRVEEDGRTRLEAIGKQLNVDELVGKLKAGDLSEQIGRVTAETVEMLGLVKATELAELRNELETLRSQMAEFKSVKTKANGAATKSTVTKLTKRVAALEAKAKKA